MLMTFIDLLVAPQCLVEEFLELNKNLLFLRHFHFSNPMVMLHYCYCSYSIINREIQFQSMKQHTSYIVDAAPHCMVENLFETNMNSLSCSRFEFFQPLLRLQGCCCARGLDCWFLLFRIFLFVVSKILVVQYFHSTVHSPISQQILTLLIEKHSVLFCCFLYHRLLVVSYPIVVVYTLATDCIS